METPQSSRAARRLLALALGVVLAPLVVEGGYRAWRAAAGELYDGTQAAHDVDLLNRHVQGLAYFTDVADVGDEGAPNRHGMALHPYIGYQAEKFWKLRDDDGQYWKSETAAANFDVLLLGGSVAADAIGVWKSEFLPLIEADPRFIERKLRLHWRTCAGHKQPQHALNLQWALSLGDQPDLVLLLDGFNELAVAAENAEYGVHPLFPMFTEMDAGWSGGSPVSGEFELIGDIVGLRRSAQELADRARRFGLMHSAVLGTQVLDQFNDFARRANRHFGDLRDLRAAEAGRRPPLVAGPPFAPDAARIRELSIEAWVQGSRTMHAACRARGIRFVHVLQPAARDLGAKPLSADEEQRSREPAVWRAAVELGYPRLREAGAQLAKEGVDFVDASHVFADHPETLYKDPCHISQEGYGILARRIVGHLLATLPQKL